MIAEVRRRTRTRPRRPRWGRRARNGAVADAEELVEPREPRSALVRRAAREVRRGRRVAPSCASSPQPIEARRGEQLRAGREVEPGATGEAVALADERDRQIGLARGDVRLEQVVADVAAGSSAREREHPLEVLGHDDRRVALRRAPSPRRRARRTSSANVDSARSCSFGRPSLSVRPKWSSKTWWRYGSSSRMSSKSQLFQASQPRAPASSVVWRTCR